MPYNPTTDESINFLQTGAKDAFPKSYEAGTIGVSDRYSTVWAEYYNKIRNFIGIVEPLCSTNTAVNEGLDSLTLWTLNPAPTLNDIIYGFAKKAYLQGRIPPTTIFPFEIVITSSLDSYTNWPSLTGTPPTMLYQCSQSLLDKITMGNFNGIVPLVDCSLKSTNETSFSTRWSLNFYCQKAPGILLIRGSIIDLNSPSVLTTQLPPITTSFPDSSTQKLFVTILGARN